MIDPKLLICQKCGNPITTAEHTSYGFRCENCYVGNSPGTTQGMRAAVRQGRGGTRINEFGSGKHQKPKHQSLG